MLAGIVPVGSFNGMLFSERSESDEKEMGVICFFGHNTGSGSFYRAGNGPEVIDIPAPVPPPDSTHATGCVNADRSVLRDLSRNPADYYAIVYTDQFPGGALRGQFSK
ncbi:MAG: CHRD domain-containing protein [Anaerolineales bacterium]|jgi:hypothetical protein